MTPSEFVEEYGRHGSIKAVTRGTGTPYHTVRKAYLEAVSSGLFPRLNVGRKSMGQIEEQIKPPVMEGRLRALRTTKKDMPAKGKVKRYLFSCAQNNTNLHDGFWENLLSLRDHYDAELHVSRFAYVKEGFGAIGDKSASFAYAMDPLRKKEDGEKYRMYFDERLDPYLSDERLEIAPGLVWCGEMNILPTAVRPLSGMDNYTGRKSAIFPHVKIALESIPTMKDHATKFNYTTGTVTLRNYIQRKAGLKAEFHHCYGALLVEVDDEGNWFCRQINGDSEGTIYDLDVRVHEGDVTTGNRVEAITWGDSHALRRDYDVQYMAENMMEFLRPKYQFLHDVLDFRSRNHHEQRDPFKLYEKYVNEEDNVRDEVGLTMDYVSAMAEAAGPECQTVVVDSNHDRALERWLREADWRSDPKNMIFYMESSLAKLKAAERREPFHMMTHWWGTLGNCRVSSSVCFLDEDHSFIICPDANGGIECGMHGHLGPNGRRGNISSFARMGRKANVAHDHSSCIYDGLYRAGTSSKLDLGYNRGPSSWSHSHIVTYRNGKRSIVTMWNNKWRA